MIRFEGVTKTYPGTSRPALNGVDLEVQKGEFVFLVGASGSGKSSFLRLVLKEDRPTKGKIFVLGQDLGAISTGKVPYFRRSLGVVFQDFRLLPNKTVFDNVAFTLQVIGKSKGFIQEAVPDVLKMVGLGGKQNRFPHELSGGEQQRVAIARAVVNKPAILLADEPTGNLDPATSAGIMTLLATINANGTTVLMATHDAGIVDQMKRRVIELVGGQIVRDERRGAYTTTTPVQKPAKREPSFDDLASGAATDAAAFTAPPSAPAPIPVEVADVPAVDDPIEALLPAASTPLVAEPVVERTPTSTRAVLPEPGSGPPPGFVWPSAPETRDKS
jgi:cell division transport system ATP-binding protein